jgi:hypothetical protein
MQKPGEVEPSTEPPLAEPDPQRSEAAASVPPPHPHPLRQSRRKQPRRPGKGLRLLLG